MLNIIYLIANLLITLGFRIQSKNLIHINDYFFKFSLFCLLCVGLQRQQLTYRSYLNDYTRDIA
jgi:hypothetical protein